MKKATLQLQDINGEILQESEVTLGDSDILVMQFPDHITYEQVREVYGGVEKALKTGEFIAIPSGITFSVIKQESH